MGSVVELNLRFKLSSASFAPVTGWNCTHQIRGVSHQPPNFDSLGSCESSDSDVQPRLMEWSMSADALGRAGRSPPRTYRYSLAGALGTDCTHVFLNTCMALRACNFVRRRC